MDKTAFAIVINYIEENLGKSDATPDYEVYVVWKCKALQNWKYLISSSLPDGMYYELTYNGDKHEWYWTLTRSLRIAGLARRRCNGHARRAKHQ